VTARPPQVSALWPAYCSAAGKTGEPLVPPLRPMVARPPSALPDEQRATLLAFEPKFDGFLN
jgi:hypothetical protein